MNSPCPHCYCDVEKHDFVCPVEISKRMLMNPGDRAKTIHAMASKGGAISDEDVMFMIGWYDSLIVFFGPGILATGLLAERCIYEHSASARGLNNRNPDFWTDRATLM